MSDTTAHSIIDRMKDAAYERENERREVERAVEKIVLGKNADRRQRVTTVITLGDDHVVEITDRDKVMWTFVVNGERGSRYHFTQEQAILHLIASRYDSNSNDSYAMATAAGRVLAIPATADN
ncbi:hypothetical protein AB0J14_04990 [Micromonospora arborensis]|uniref:hypothetical protein n=1 Tax=Micromonospora arborensis TaxID=2116518 RepID=UPI0033E8010F